MLEEHTCCRTSHKRYISQNMSPHRSRCLRIQEATQRLALPHRNISEHEHLQCRRSVRPKVAGSVKRPLSIMRPYTGFVYLGVVMFFSAESQSTSQDYDSVVLSQPHVPICGLP
jgi:hypothetical protein